VTWRGAVIEYAVGALGDAGLYMTVQLLLLSLLVLTERATRAASVKASLTPRFFIAEHSIHVLIGRPHDAVD
jgi:hypothetical protein